MIENAIAYFEEQTGLKLPSRPARDYSYDFKAKTEPAPDFAILTVDIGGPNLSVTFAEGVGKDPRPTRGNGNPYNIYLQGMLHDGRAEFWLLKNGDQELNGIEGIDLNPDSVFANIRHIGFQPRRVAKDGRHLCVGEREPA